jgi:hypothetical protein
MCIKGKVKLLTYGVVEIQLHTFLTTALDEVSGQFHVLAALLPGKEVPVPIGYEAGCASELIWTWQRRK